MSEVLGSFGGTILIATAPLRARAVPVVLPVVLLIGVIAAFTLAGFYAGLPLAAGLAVIAYAGIGALVLRFTNDGWESKLPVGWRTQTAPVA